MKKLVSRVFAFIAAVTVVGMTFTTSAKGVSAEENFGTGGRLYFSNGYSVALNWADPYDAYAVQSLCDAWDSAVMETSYIYGTTLIADHAGQGFNIIKSYGVGSTVEIRDAWGGCTTYVCVGYYPNATWVDGVVTLPDGRNAWAGDAGLWMKTCNDSSGYSNTVSYWTPAW